MGRLGHPLWTETGGTSQCGTSGKGFGMKIARIGIDDKECYAVVGEKAFRLIDGDVFGAWKETGDEVAVSAARLLAGGPAADCGHRAQ